MGAALAGGLAGFLVFNLHPAKIFMGDSGSLLLGLMAYVMAVNVIQTPSDEACLAWCVPVAAMCLLAYPLVDTLRVFTLRVLSRRSPFTPDRRHIHHLLMQLGWGHRLTSATLWMYSLLFVVLALQPREAWGDIGVTAQFFILLGLAFALASLPYFMVRTGMGVSQLFPKWMPTATLRERARDLVALPGPRRRTASLNCASGALWPSFLGSALVDFTPNRQQPPCGICHWIRVLWKWRGRATAPR